MSPFSAVSLLALFAKRHVKLTQEQFDEAVDALVLLLEKCNDEKFRITPKGEESEA